MMNKEFQSNKHTFVQDYAKIFPDLFSREQSAPKIGTV